MRVVGRTRRVARAAGCVACGRRHGPRRRASVRGLRARRALAARRVRALRAADPSRPACPAAHAAFPRAWAPVAYEGVSRQLVERAEVPRRAAGRGRDGGAHGREPPGGAARPGGRARARPGRCRRAPARAGSTRRGCSPSPSPRRIERPLADCLVRARPLGPPGRRGRARPPRPGPSRRARARDATARWRSWSTTSTRPARRLTRAPARWTTGGGDGAGSDLLRPNALKRVRRRRGRPRRPTPRAAR